MIRSLHSFLKGLRRDLRSRELVWLFLALTLSVTALSSVSFLADRMQRAFQFDARQLLAADLLLVSDHPLPEQFLEEGELRRLRIAQTVVFPTMATVGSQSKLASLKAATPAYPLRGQLEVAQVKSANIGSAPGVAHTSPSVGQVWVEPAMMNSLGAHVGDVMTLGESHFIIGGVLTRELDRGAGSGMRTPL